jgi:hypothetical protein
MSMCVENTTAGCNCSGEVAYILARSFSTGIFFV